MKDRSYPSFPIPGVGAIVVGSKGILLVRRDKEPARGLWSIPGGAVEVGEGQEEAVYREVYEETGVRVEVLGLVDTFDVILQDEAGETEFHYLLNHYLCEAHTEETTPESPEAEVGWFHPDSMPVDEMPPPVIDLLAKLKERISELME
ncbi:MAG: NUDIX domain-containing protein [Candidatus Thorarchaeota archaeon]|nr:MAG: NUDIX domain-containing protein [Candidatus Thorarchaeota archaeon]